MLPSSPRRERLRCAAPLLALLVGFASQVFAQSGSDVQLVCLDTDGGAHRVRPTETMPDAGAWQGVSALAGADIDVQACWVWNRECPPARHLPGSDLEPMCDVTEPPSTAASGSGLFVRLLDLEDSPPASPVVTLTAAPSAMWREVPRSLLPAWSATTSLVRLPSSSGPWRVQACTEHRCSLWTDVRGGTEEVSLRLNPAQVISYRTTADGAPLADARFYLLRPGRGGLSQTEILGLEQSDEDGRVAFPSGRTAVCGCLRHGARSGGVLEVE